MDEEFVPLNKIQVLCRIINIPSDGAFLFCTVSYLVYGDVSMAGQIRADIYASRFQRMAEVQNPSLNNI